MYMNERMQPPTGSPEAPVSSKLSYAHRNFAATAARLHAHYDDGTEYIASNNEGGLTGVLTRSVEVRKADFVYFAERAHQRDLEADVVRGLGATHHGEGDVASAAAETAAPAGSTWVNRYE
jgi:hypothetical protein